MGASLLRIQPGHRDRAIVHGFTARLGERDPVAMEASKGGRHRLSSTSPCHQPAMTGFSTQVNSGITVPMDHRGVMT
jgi:hypothetical protein